jgi:MFS family permease
VFRDRVFLAFVGVNLLTALVFMQHISMLPITMAEDGLSPQTFGAVIALNGVLIVAGQLFVAPLLKHMRRATAMATAALVMGIGFGLTAFAHVPWFYGLTVLIWTIGEMLNAPSNSATNAELSPPDMRGRYQGVFSLSWSAAAFVAPVLGGAVLENFGSAPLWLGCFAVSVLAAALNLLAGPARERRAAQVAAAELAAADGYAQMAAPSAVAAAVAVTEASVDAVPATSPTGVQANLGPDDTSEGPVTRALVSTP